MLERMKELEAKATPAPWGTEDGVEWHLTPNGPEDRAVGIKLYNPRNPRDEDDETTIGMLNHYIPEGQSNAKLIAALRNLAPELIAVWEAANKAGRLFNACADTFDPSEEPTELTDPALDALHKGWIGFAETVNVLNRKAGTYAGSKSVTV